MSKDEYDPLKGIRKTQATLLTEVTGYTVAGKIAGLDTTGHAGTALGVGASLAGMPSLVSGASNIFDSLKTLDVSYGKKKKIY